MQKTSSYMVEPEIAIAVDTGLANDVPGGDANEQSLGKGPQILLYDGGLIPNQALRQFVIDVAKEEKYSISGSLHRRWKNRRREYAFSTRWCCWIIHRCSDTLYACTHLHYSL